MVETWGGGRGSVEGVSRGLCGGGDAHHLRARRRPALSGCRAMKWAGEATPLLSAGATGGDSA